MSHCLLEICKRSEKSDSQTPHHRREQAVHTQPHHGRPTDDELIAVVERADNGMSALDLLNHFVAEGYPQRDVQRAIQRALNANSLELGSKLRLYARARVAA